MKISDEGAVKHFLEGEEGSRKHVVELHCSECGRISRFTAQDEDANGEVHCPCGKSHVTVEGDGLRGAQRKLDETNRIFKDFDKALRDPFS